jgi:hypothetical protein
MVQKKNYLDIKRKNLSYYKMSNNSKIDLIKKYAPVVFLHTDEKYYPCKVEDYLFNSSLWADDVKIVNEGYVTEDILPKQRNNIKYRLDIDENFWGGDRKTSDVPFYAYFKEKEDRYQILYVFFYAYNGNAWLCYIPEIFDCCYYGQHQADVEHITVEIKKEDLSLKNRVIRVYFGAHGSKSGQWISGDDLEWYNDKILCFSAKNSHASYQDKGIICRGFGCISDFTDFGSIWNPDEIVHIDNETKWNQYIGKLGSPDNVSTPLNQAWWENETEVSTNWYTRFFCPCL